MLTDHVQPRFGTNNSFRSYATKMWNALPTVIKTCKSLDSFKTALKGHLRMAAIQNRSPVKPEYPTHPPFPPHCICLFFPLLPPHFLKCFFWLYRRVYLYVSNCYDEL